MTNSTLDLIDKLNRKLFQAESAVQLLWADFSNNNGKFSLNQDLIETMFSNITDLITEAHEAGDEIHETRNRQVGGKNGH